ncbi:hypothetical protein M0813_13457 [Anaeramoeba flamelloides]|uniref:Uncharacterized protein n=1 Tax=Anaeramoeba flamelloides TaxID=1746091 RepID=A0ABQ8Z8G3_9EUKA|nr:hypothetical protein M0813_13457 [Anaeramoeba flamelloides]
MNKNPNKQKKIRICSPKAKQGEYEPKKAEQQLFAKYDQNQQKFLIQSKKLNVQDRIIEYLSRFPSLIQSKNLNEEEWGKRKCNIKVLNEQKECKRTNIIKRSKNTYNYIAIKKELIDLLCVAFLQGRQGVTKTIDRFFKITMGFERIEREGFERCFMSKKVYFQLQNQEDQPKKYVRKRVPKRYAYVKSKPQRNNKKSKPNNFHCKNNSISGNNFEIENDSKGGKNVSKILPPENLNGVPKRNTIKPTIDPQTFLENGQKLNVEIENILENNKINEKGMEGDQEKESPVLSEKRKHDVDECLNNISYEKSNLILKDENTQRCKGGQNEDESSLKNNESSDLLDSINFVYKNDTIVNFKNIGSESDYEKNFSEDYFEYNTDIDQLFSNDLDTNFFFINKDHF